ncbi:winged helix-turn-helix transcriptional regulator [bacterium]|nr:winged helix-turn-helix transcriptional regulator [bacterium]
MDSREKILATMRKAGKPLKAGEIAELSGLDTSAVNAAMTILKKEEMIISPKRCYWQPK